MTMFVFAEAARNRPAPLLFLPTIMDRNWAVVDEPCERGVSLGKFAHTNTAAEGCEEELAVQMPA